MSSFDRRFLGTTPHPVDKKGRMSISRRFQSALDSDQEGRIGGILCVERRQDARCLWVFNGEGFDREMERFDKLALEAEGDHDEQRDFFEFVTPFTLDNSGRLVIPQKFRDVVQIGDTAVAVGMNSRIEIWGKERWDSRRRGQHSPIASPDEAKKEASS
ncbi:MAG: hypothetical protein AAGG01_06890 [Planctomycetota bacterium]